MNIVDKFCVGELYSNDQIRLSLGLENLGGIRPSLNARRNLQHLAIMTYTAQGREGDQQLTGRNKRLVEQYLIPIPFYGFINVGKQVYRFLGLLELLRHYQELQADIRGSLRNVWIFEFRIHREPNVVEIDQALNVTIDLLKNRNRELTEYERQVEDLDSNIDSVELIEIERVRRDLVQVPPYNFEHLVRALMEANGFRNVTVTAASGDGGIDVNAYAD
jgi:hypothetical protein